MEFADSDGMCDMSLVGKTTVLAVTLLACGSFSGCGKGTALVVRDAQADQPSQDSDAALALGGQPGSGGAIGNGGGPGAGGTAGGGGVLGAGGAIGGGGRSGAGGTTGSGGVLGAGGAMVTGGSLGAGGAGTGGTTGNNCYDSSGAIATSVRTCANATDCRIETIHTCCGSDRAVGLASTASCDFVPPNCTGLGCAKNPYPQADDGNTATQGKTVAVKCEQNLCTSYVSSAGTGGAGGLDGGEGSGGRDGSAGDAATGACSSDSDCIFRPSAGCCGQCLAVSDPVPATIPCGAACAAFTTCACVNGHCSVGTLPTGSACDTAHDLCQAGTKCCVACGPRALDGGTECAAPMCANVSMSSAGGAQCPVTG